LRRTLVLCLALTPVLHAHAGAQGRVPARALAAADADTNSAQAYYQRGMALLDSRPEAAVDAFYWATRLEPGWAEAWYARRTAMLMARPQLVGIHLKPRRSERDARALRETDSLYLRALGLDPFVPPRLDKRALHSQLREMAPRELRATEDPEALDLMAELVMLQSGPGLRGWNDFAKERYPQALAAYAEALPEARNRSGIHAQRARIFFMTDRPDSALAEMRNALRQSGGESGTEVLFRVDSRALLEHSLGVILEKTGDRDGAREAYGRALREDASYHPAHAALASLAAAAGDTAAALREMELAVQAAGSDPVLRYGLARLLSLAGRFAEAEPHLREAIRAEPCYAPPYALLGGVLEKQGHAAPALEQYRAFLEHASRDHELVPAIRERISALGGGAAPTGS
jgi:tetratricopeptide (TPR) repeat protein